MKIVSIVGMAGSGKSIVSRVFEGSGFIRVRFGDVTDQELQKRGLPINEANERQVREQLRKELGMAAYAILNRPRIDKVLEHSNAVLDGLYSWEEYLYFKSCYGESFYNVAVYASPQTRYTRLTARATRGLTPEQAASRDRAEIENLNKGGPIAMADFVILNECSPDDLKRQAQSVLEKITGING